jgi:hypothetical protein
MAFTLFLYKCSTMTIINALEGGLAGATTLSLLHKAIDKIDSKAQTRLLHKSDLLKKIKRQSNKKGSIPVKLYIRLASELLASAGYFGLSALGKKKNAVLRGALLGAAAGFGVAFLNNQDNTQNQENRNKTRDQILTIALYTAGGLVAGAAIKRLNKRKKK